MPESRSSTLYIPKTNRSTQCRPRNTDPISVEMPIEEEEAIEETETTVKFVQNKAVTVLPNSTAGSTANALTVTNAVIPKKTASFSRTTKHALDTDLKILGFNTSIRQTETKMAITTTKLALTVNTIPS